MQGEKASLTAAVKDAAKKFDSAKPRMDLLPMDALEQVADVLGFGAQKYAAHNWAKGMAWSRLLGACLRHVGRWSLGEDKDPETGLSHLAHAACCILFLLAYEKRGVGQDDRFKVETSAKH
jgi:hypothetical protein